MCTAELTPVSSSAFQSTFQRVTLLVTINLSPQGSLSSPGIDGIIWGTRSKKTTWERAMAVG